MIALLNPSSRVSFKLGIPEGLTVNQIATKISEKLAIPAEEVTAALADPAAIGLPAEANGNPEAGCSRRPTTSSRTRPRRACSRR